MQKPKLKYIQYISNGVIFMKYAVIQLSQTYSAAFSLLFKESTHIIKVVKAHI